VACNNGNNIRLIGIEFVVFKNSFLPSFSFALIMEQRMVILGPFSLEGLPTDVAVMIQRLDRKGSVSTRLLLFCLFDYLRFICKPEV
jgi:hypothetical protein